MKESIGADHGDFHESNTLRRAYLTNIAAAIRHTMSATLTSTQMQRLEDSVRLLARLAASEERIAPNLSAAGEAEEAEAANEAAASFLSSLSMIPVESRTIDIASIQRDIRRDARGGANANIALERALPGGRSKLTALLAVENADNLPAHVVLRQDWTSSVVGTSVYSEFEVLKLLASVGIRVPEPLILKAASDDQGPPFIIVGLAAGKSSGDSHLVLPEAEAPVLALAHQLALLHSIDTDLVQGMPGIRQANFTAAELSETVRSYTATILDLEPRSPLVEDISQWLLAHADEVAEHEKAIVHGDLGFHNILCNGAELTAILDWELSHIGSAAYDLGYLRNAITDPGLWDRFMATYKSAGGRNVGALAIDYYHLYAFMWLQSLMVRARAAVRSGHIVDVGVAKSVADIAPRAVERMLPTYRRVVAGA